MRFRIKAGGAAVHITFDRTPKPQPPAPPSPRAADLDNPYGRYYGKARSLSLIHISEPTRLRP